MELYNELPVGWDWNFSCLHNSSFSAQRLHHIGISLEWGERSSEPLDSLWNTVGERERERSHRTTGRHTHNRYLVQCYEVMIFESLLLNKYLDNHISILRSVDISDSPEVF